MPARVQVVAPVAAQNGTGGDVLASLIGDDRAYLTFLTNEDRGIVNFECPAQVEGTVRTVFARTRGWYEIRMRRLGFPDLAQIDRLTSQPGYPVQFALRNFRKSSEQRLAQVAGGGGLSSPTPGRN